MPSEPDDVTANAVVIEDPRSAFPRSRHSGMSHRDPAHELRRTSSLKAAPRQISPPVEVDAAVDLGRWLQRIGYHFITVTPATHHRVNARHGNEMARTLTDIFGWSRPFTPATLPAAAFEMMRRGNLLEHTGDALKSRVRFSTLGHLLLMHSAFPTEGAEAVFFGPDTYRFGNFIRRTLARPSAAPVIRIVDIGCGSGAGGLLAAELLRGDAPALTLCDINPASLGFAAVSAALAGATRVERVESDVLQNVLGAIDLVLCNPPFVVDASERTYRHGGRSHGTDIAQRVVRESLARLSPGGRLLLYSGAPIIDGQDLLRAALEPIVKNAGASFEYEELDPDIFGEELDQAAYSTVERIAAVGLLVTLPER